MNYFKIIAGCYVPFEKLDLINTIVGKLFTLHVTNLSLIPVT